MMPLRLFALAAYAPNLAYDYPSHASGVEAQLRAAGHDSGNFPKVTAPMARMAI